MADRPRAIELVKRGARRRLVSAIADATSPGATEIASQMADLRATVAGLESVVSELGSAVAGLRTSVEAASEQLEGKYRRLDDLAELTSQIRSITGQHLDRTPEQRRHLLEVRASAEYVSAMAEPEPLVSVRIATYDRPDILFERTLPSVFSQTYSNIEVIVVGDAASEETVSRAGMVKDPRFRFVNLPIRGSYPTDAHARWLVAGSPAMNHGAHIAAGSWIAPLDDDDDFAPDHVERLLTTAREGAFEMAYGRMRVMRRGHPDDSTIIGEFPPKLGAFGFQAAIYLAALKFFEYETSSWVLGEPGDWNLCRRMMAAGVRIGYTDAVVTTLYPSGPSAEDTATAVDG